jgi:hypothetical protein
MANPFPSDGPPDDPLAAFAPEAEDAPADATSDAARKTSKPENSPLHAVPRSQTNQPTPVWASVDEPIDSDEPA